MMTWPTAKMLLRGRTEPPDDDDEMEAEEGDREG
jgi:hypothetical protein